MCILCGGADVDTDKFLPLEPMGPGQQKKHRGGDFKPALAAGGYHALLLQMQSYTCWPILAAKVSIPAFATWNKQSTDSLRPS